MKRARTTLAPLTLVEPATYAHQRRARPVSKPAAPVVEPAVEKTAVPALGEIGLNQFAPYLLNRLSTQWNAEMQAMLRDHNVSTTKMRALAVLAVASGITVNELALFAVTEQSTMSRTLDSLEDQDLIRRRAKAGDMRVREVFITEKGLTLFSTLWPDIYALYGRFFADIDEPEFRGFVATLHKILRNVRGTES